MKLLEKLELELKYNFFQNGNNTSCPPNTALGFSLTNIRFDCLIDVVIYLFTQIYCTFNPRRKD